MSEPIVILYFKGIPDFYTVDLIKRTYTSLETNKVIQADDLRWPLEYVLKNRKVSIQ